MVVVIVISPIIWFMLVVVLIVDRIATSLAAKTTVLGMVMSSASYGLVVLILPELCFAPCWAPEWSPVASALC